MNESVIYTIDYRVYKVETTSNNTTPCHYFYNDPRKSVSHICAITPKGLVNLKLFQESIIKSSFT
jgi:hypothetical protein